MMGSFMISSVCFWFICSVSGLTATPCGDFDSCKIELKKVSSHKMWNDKGSGSNLDFSCWNPDFLDDSYSMLGSIPRGNYGQPSTAYVLKGKDGVLDSPVGYLEIWTDKGTGSVGDGSLWAPKCNQGYRAVGHYCQAGYSMPSLDAMKCVREDLVVPCGHDFVWNDKGSGASTDVSVYVTKDPYGYVSGMVAGPAYTDIAGVSCLAGPVIKKVELTTYECTDTTGSVIPIEIPIPGHQIAITSPNYPNSFDQTRLNCKWSIKALHGARVKVQLVDSDLNDGCFDNILEVVDDTPTSGRSSLKYPGKSAKCGQNDFGAINKAYETDAETVSVSFKSLKNNGSAIFKLEVTTDVPRACPASKPSGCPAGPCCTGADCCVINTGKEAQEISIPDGSKPGLDCQYKLVAPKGAQIAVNFLEMDIRADVNQACLTDYLMLQDPISSASSLVGEDGLTFCGQRLPNYPGPSVIVSGGNSLVLKYHTDESTAKKGSGFKATVSAINPICNVMNFEYKYGQEICNSTCGVPYKIPREPRKRSTRKPRTTTSTRTTTTTTITTSPPRTINETCEEYNVDYLGNDIDCLPNSSPSWEDCAKICNNNGRCTHWTWLSEDFEEPDRALTCCIKTSDAGRWTQKGCVSGSKACGACEETDIDLAGNDVDAVLDVSTWEQCSHICKQRGDCSFWTWVGEDYTINPDILHKCHLKGGDSGRAPVTGLISGSSACGDWAPPITTPRTILQNETCESMNTKLISKEDGTNVQDVPTWEQCANLCAGISTCSHWNWIGSDCKEDWCKYEVNQYRYFERRTSFANAQDACKAEGGDLASVTSMGIIKFVLPNLSRPEDGGYWIGSKKDDTSDKFVWVDGESFEFTNWAPGEPNSNNENCVEMGLDGKFNDVGCQAERAFICKKKADDDIKDNQCSILTSAVDTKQVSGFVSGTSECGKAAPITTTTTTTTTQTTLPATTEPVTEVPPTEGTQCTTLAITIQVINAQTGGPLPRATVRINSKRVSRDQSIPALKSTHTTDANGEVTEIGTLYGTYSFAVFMQNGSDIFRSRVDETIDNATCRNAACTECSVHLKLKAEKQEQEEEVKNCTCKGQLSFVNELTELPIAGACVSYTVDALSETPTDAGTDATADTLAERLLKLIPFSRSIIPNPINREVESNCKDDWCKFGPTNALFRYFESTTTWQDARETCHTFDAHLASIPSMNVNNFISEKLPKPDDGGYWIGGTNIDGKWVWGDESPWNYANWADGEPNGNNENCVELGDGGSFNDVDCNSQRRFVCKKFDEPAPPTCQLLTDVNGKIHIDTYQVGRYVFTVNHEEYKTQQFATDRLGGSIAGNCDECNIKAKYKLKKQLCERNTSLVRLKITVLNQETLDPVEGVQLTTYISEGLNTTVTQTNENGTSFVPITEEGDYTIEASLSTMQPVSITKNIFCDPKDCEACKPVVALYMSSPPPESTIPPTEETCTRQIENSLTVLAFDNSNDDPLPSASISILYNGGFLADNVGLTNSSYKTEITENGLYTVKASADGYVANENSMAVTCGSCQEDDIDFMGNDINYIENVASWDECAQLCKNNEACSHWTWVSERYTEFPPILYICHLKNNDAGRVKTKGLISGAEDCDKTNCHDCINVIKLYMDPDVCEETDFTISVYEAVSRTPIQGATVRITDVSTNSPRVISKVEGRPMKTDVNGMLIAPSPGEAKLKIEVEKEGYEVLNGTVDVFCQHPCESCKASFNAVVNEKLCEGSDIIDLQVSVNDKNGNPISQATVTMKLTSSAAGATSANISEVMITDATGLVSPPIFVSGGYMLAVSKQGFVSKSQEITVDNANACKQQHIPVDITLNKQREEAHCESSEIKVSVFDEATMKGLPGTKVTLISSDEVVGSVETDFSGSVAIPVSENGEYTVTVVKEGFAERKSTTSIQYPDSCSTELQLGIKEKTCPDTIMPIVIVNNATLTPIPNALVRVILTNSKAGTSITIVDKPKYTNENGTAFFKTPMNGKYVVGVTVDGFDPIEVTEDLMCDTDNCAGCAPVVTIHPPPTYCQEKSLKLIIMDCKTNSRVANANVITTIDTERGEIDGGTIITSETGEILIPITENGIYNSIITSDGYVVMKNSFEVAISMDDCDAFDAIDTVPICPPAQPGCTEVSLSWTNDKDIDLEAYRVNIKDTNDTCSSKPACCEGCKKEECEGVTESIDISEGLNGIETITYCNTNDYSNMIYVSDPTGEGKNLPNSGARIVFTNGEKELIVRIDSTNQPENSKYWLAGCLSTEDTSFNFINLNKFTQDKPEIEDPLYCYDRANIEKKTREDATLDNARITVNIFDAETKTPISGALAEASTAKESISRLSKEDGAANIKVTKNGEYSVEASAKGYVGSKTTITMDCKPGEVCENMVAFSLLPAGNKDKIEIVLNWGADASDLDLHTMQINKESPGAGCETYFNKMSSCPNTKLDGNKFNGGSDGGEKITISNPADNLKYTYMVFVKDNSADTDQLETSGAHIDISDGLKSLTKTLPKFTSNTASGANFWFVGCLRVVGQSYEFAAVDTLSRDSPYVTEKLYCDNLFKVNSLAGQEKASQFCEGVSMKIRLQTDQHSAFSSTFSGCGASCTSVQIISVGNDEQKTIFEGSPEEDTLSVPITSNGQYLVKVDGDGYEATEDAFEVSCDITKCQSCTPSFVLPVSPQLESDQARIMLSWANFPNALQIYSLERGCEEMDTDLVGDDIEAVLDVRSWQACSQLCKQKEGCSHWTWVGEEYTKNTAIVHKCHLKNGDAGRGKETGLVSGKAGCGDSGPVIKKSGQIVENGDQTITNEPGKESTGSSISISKVSTFMKGKFGMIFVENVSKVPKFSEVSNVLVTITDGETISKNAMDLTNYGGEDFWIAGCYKLDNGVINFSPEASFLNSRPDVEVPDYCLRFYGA